MGDFSRDTFNINKLKHYVGVRMQQGVPLLDADWNEQEDIRKYELRAFLKWFVGNGVPQGNDGFRIEPHPKGTENDFTIKGGDGTPEGAGRCLVDGWDALIEQDIDYTQQSLFNNKTLADGWEVEPLNPISPPVEGERTDTVYLDVWEREVDAREDEELVNPAISIETCVRLKREWVVRVAQGLDEKSNLQQYLRNNGVSQVGHAYYAIANITRKTKVNTISEQDIRNLRQTCLPLHSIKEYIDFKATVSQVGALSTSGGFVTGPIHIKTGEWSALTANATQTYGVMGRLTRDLETGSDYRTAGVVGISEIEDKHGVFAKAPEDTHALYVQGSALFTGAKTGYVVDVFKNASGKTLKTGDVVKLKGTAISRFFGDNDKIPVAEVVLADKENDNCTIGIVDRKAIPEEIGTGKKSKPGDPTVIKKGEELYVVTLGTYYRCKVDASDVPIKVGDLLTSSKNPGFAKKAVDPKIGSIIGKALQSLGKGTGYIAVFVNIQ